MATARLGNSSIFTRHDDDSNLATQTGVRVTLQGDNQDRVAGALASPLDITHMDSLPTSPIASSTTKTGAPANNHLTMSTASNSNTPAIEESPSQPNFSATSPPFGRPSTPPIPPTLPPTQSLDMQLTGSNASMAAPLPPPTLPKHRFRRTISRWNDWWLLEVAAGILSIISLIAIIAILAHFDGKPLTEWYPKITPNAVISVLATISKSSVLLPVAECISQLIWLRFRSPHSLQLIQRFDEAIRGVLGSFKILLSTEAIAAWFGAIITLTALAFEPFVQQVLLLESRDVLLDTANVSVPVPTIFNTGKTQSASFPTDFYPLGDVGHSLDPSIRAASFDGIYSTTITPLYTCNAPICRFGSFASLAVCSSCTDVIKELKRDCDKACYWWTYTTPANIRIGAYYESGAHTNRTFITVFNSSVNTDFDMPIVAKFATLKLDYINYTLEPISAYDCSLRLCIKTWTGASFQGSSFEEIPPAELDFQKVTHAPRGQEPFSTLEIDPNFNATRFGTYKINWYDWKLMKDFLATQFSYRYGALPSLPSGTELEGIPIMLYKARDIPSMIGNLADSLTKMIRTSGDEILVAGQGFQNETFIKIQWPWISLPVLVIISANFLLAIVIIQTKRRQAPVWKSSVLALLLHGLETNTVDTRGSATTSLSEMKLLAKKEQVKLNGGSIQDLKFVNK